MNIHDHYTFEKPNLDPYFVNYTGKCMITHLKNEINGLSYMIDTERCRDYNLYEEKIEKLDEIPPVGVVFAIDFGDEGIFRAVRSNNSSHDLFLIDSGETLHIESPSTLKMFQISTRSQKSSAKAIPCRVIKLCDEMGNVEIDIAENLVDALFEQTDFEIQNILSDVLMIVIRRVKPEAPVEIENDNNGIDNGNGLQLTQEQLDILYEEPETTTNASKAVLGYVPHDDERICQFYNPKTGRCFKENSCRLEHIKPLEEGWTRDRRAATYKLVPSVLPQIGTTVDVLITCVKDIDEIYVYIPKNAEQTNISLASLKAKLNSDEIKASYKQMKRVPGPHELVVFKYQDTFYRGRFFGGESEDHLFKVYLLDYGGIEKVPLKDIYEWHSICECIPALSYRCRLANVRKPLQGAASKSYSDKVRKILMDSQRSGLLCAEIIQCTDDLYVKLRDEEGFDLGELMCVVNIAEPVPIIIPSSDMIPG